LGLIKNLSMSEGWHLSGEPSEGFWNWLGFRPSKTGVRFNEETAKRFTAVFACIRVLSETLASMPIILYRDRERGNKASGKDRAVDHPLYDILHDAPNKEMPAFMLKETLMNHICSSGNGYAQIQRNRRGSVISLNLLPWTLTDVQRNQTTWELEYWTNDRGKAIKLNPDEVFHIPGLGFDGIKGYSPIRMAMEAIGLGLAAEEFGAAFFSGGANAGGVVEYDGKMSEPAKETFRKSFMEKYGGLGKSNSVIFLENGSKYTKVAIPNNEAQFLETRRFQKEEVASIYRVPLHLIQDLTRSTNNNIEHQSLEFVMYTMLPWFTRWEQFSNFKLLTREERAQGYFAEFLINALLRGDTDARAKMLHLMRQDGVISADQWRELENMNPQEGGQGRHYLINGNMISVDTAAKQPPRQSQGQQPQNQQGGGQTP
jgi:HK97 family phage portal protein